MSGRRVIRGLYFQFYCFFYGYLSPFTFLLSLHEKVRFYTFLKMKNHKVSYSILQNHKVSYFIVHICVIFLHMYKQLLLSDQVEPWHFLWDSKRDFNFPIPTSLDLDLHIYSLDWDAKQNTFMPNYWNDWKYDAEQWLNNTVNSVCCEFWAGKWRRNVPKLRRRWNEMKLMIEYTKPLLMPWLRQQINNQIYRLELKLR